MSGDKPFIQAFKVNGQLIDDSSLLNVTYLEYISLTGSSFIAEINDPQGEIRDNYGLVEDAEIEIEFGDVKGESEALFVEKFIVKKAPIMNGAIIAQGFSKVVHNLKVPCEKPIYFVDKSVKNIIAKLVPNVAIDCNVLGTGTYHLNYDMTPSRLLRKIARDFGAEIWYCRGKIHFKSLDSIYSQMPSVQAGINSDKAEIRIRAIDILRDKSQYERIKKKNYHSWSIDKGMLKSKTNTDKSKIIVTYTPEGQLDNLSKYSQPIMVFECVGDSDLEPAAMLEFLMFRLTQDQQVDESLPVNMCIIQISHFTEGERYINKVIVGVKNE